MRPGEERATELLLASLDWVEVDRVVAHHAGELARRYLRSHAGLSSPY